MPTLAPPGIDTPGRIFPLARRLAAAIETGTHPATRTEVVPDAACGDCVFWVDRDRTKTGRRSKCAKASARRGGPHLPPETPACALYSPPESPGAPR